MIPVPGPPALLPFPLCLTLPWSWGAAWSHSLSWVPFLLPQLTVWHGGPWHPAGCSWPPGHLWPLSPRGALPGERPLRPLCQWRVQERGHLREPAHRRLPLPLPPGPVRAALLRGQHAQLPARVLRHLPRPAPALPLHRLAPVSVRPSVGVLRGWPAMAGGSGGCWLGPSNLGTPGRAAEARISAVTADRAPCPSPSACQGRASMTRRPEGQGKGPGGRRRPHARTGPSIYLSCLTAEMQADCGLCWFYFHTQLLGKFRFN